jgi:nucleotide-sensitive chloride channel 1A
MPSVKFIDAVPKFVSKEEHTALVGSTPTSFNDIPPVIKYRDENVSITLDPPLENFSSENTVQGTLYVLTRYAILKRAFLINY